MDARVTTRPRCEAPTVSAAARRRRLGAAALMVALLLAGSAWGQDDAFPFGPFRMYATKQKLDGATSWYALEGVTANGTVVDIPTAQVGLRRAELEGQMDRLWKDRELVGLLADAYERHQPGAARLLELRVVKHLQPVRGGVPSGEPMVRIVVTWRR